MTTLRTFNFSIILRGIPEVSAEVPYEEYVKRECERMDEMGARLFAAGCDDTTLSARGSTYFLDFECQAASLGNAVGSVIEQVQRAGFQVAKVEIDESEPDR